MLVLFRNYYIARTTKNWPLQPHGLRASRAEFLGMLPTGRGPQEAKDTSSWLPQGPALSLFLHLPPMVLQPESHMDLGVTSQNMLLHAFSCSVLGRGCCKSKGIWNSLTRRLGSIKAKSQPHHDSIINCRGHFPHGLQHGLPNTVVWPLWPDPSSNASVPTHLLLLLPPHLKHEAPPPPHPVPCRLCRLTPSWDCTLHLSMVDSSLAQKSIHSWVFSPGT